MKSKKNKTELGGSEIPGPKDLIPPNESIVDEALDRMSSKMNPDYIEKNFYEVIDEAMKIGYQIYLSHQGNARDQIIGLIKKSKTKDDDLIWDTAIRFEKSASQMRKARAGGAFELYVQKLLTKIGIPSEKPTGMLREKLNRTDLVVPNKELASKRPDRAKFISIKTTLAERWKQVVPEQNRGWAIYLLTLDDNIAASKAKEIDKSGIVLFVRDELKENKGLKNLNGIRKLSELPEHLLSYKK